MPLISIEEAIEEFRQGKFLIIVDDAKRENEGDLTIAAEAVTPEAINFMITNARGMLCVPVTRDCLERLNIPMMAKDESEAIHGTALRHVHRLSERQYYGHFGLRPGGHYSCPSGPDSETGRLRPTGAHFSIALLRRRGAGSARAYGGQRGLGQAGGDAARRRHLRGDEPERHYGPDAGPGGFFQGARHQPDIHCTVDCPP